MSSSDHIVDRLRFLTSGTSPVARRHIITEAAAEIERLRAELEACICRRGEAIELTGGHQHSTPIQMDPDE